MTFRSRGMREIGKHDNGWQEKHHLFSPAKKLEGNSRSDRACAASVRSEDARARVSESDNGHPEHA